MSRRMKPETPWRELYNPAMPRTVILPILLVLGLPQAAGVPAPLAARVTSIAAEIQPAVVAMRRDLHQHPELGFRETRTAGIVADRLRALKFDEVRTGVGVTGVVGILKGGKPGK